MKLENVNFGPVIENQDKEIIVLDLSENNEELQKIDVANTNKFTEYVENKLQGKLGIGKYMEDRVIYNHSEVFSGERTVHLGIDLWIKEGMKVFCPYEGKIHSLADNNSKGDYGPTIIVKHNINGEKIFTLYGHLSKDSLKHQKNDKIKRGEIIGHIGNNKENGEWPPHLHFQIILDMMGKEGDFAGVCKIEEKEKYKEICPDPNLILKINKI